MVRASLVTGLSLALTTVALAACDDGRVNQIPQPDGGVDAGPEPEPPPPPVFPLKSGDLVEVPVVGARVTDPCALGEGFCDRAIRASYEIDSVAINPTSGHWEVTAHYFYEMDKADTSYESIQRLNYSEVVPFGDLTAQGDSDDGDAVFVTDGAPTDEMNANAFPFFHYESEYANETDSAFAKAAMAFATRIYEVDPEANVTTQAANATIGAYYKDSAGTPTYLHKVEVKYHPMGFLCSWDERLIPWTDGMQRAEGAFAGQGIPIAASFDSIRVVRDGQRFRCSCFDLKCKTTDGTSLCLDPKDPDAAASEENCQ